MWLPPSARAFLRVMGPLGEDSPLCCTRETEERQAWEPG